ncbi:Phage protein [hydrothermal vent metagenome]|uniref:Phage protein n=1 Tax=hydrothermal vent metagenome TaxID=652676 RepID=A0A3B1CD69_9ZZZZ
MHEHLYENFSRAILEAQATGKGAKEVQAAPRGHAKSTLTTLILPLWCVVFKHRRFIGVLSDTTEQAEEFLESIKAELEVNERLLADFPTACGEGRTWQTGKILTRNAVKIACWGKRKRLRGVRFGSRRPDLVVLDDLENDENVDSPEQREKDRNWFFKAVMKVGGRYTVYLVVGTILHYDSLLARLLKRPGWSGKKWQAVIHWSGSPLWEQWETLFSNPDNALAEKQADRFFKRHKKALLKGTKVLWPEMEPYDDLMKMRVSDGPAYFDSEKQNEPINPTDCLFQEDWLTFYDKDEMASRLKNSDYQGFYCAVDPSMGGASRKADPSAILVGGVRENGVIDVLVADIKKRHPDRIMEDLFHYHDQYHFDRVVIEEVQFQELFKDQVIKEGARRGSYLAIQGVRPSTDKTLRISKLQPHIKNALIRFSRQDRLLLDQLKYFPKAEHDDGPDALEMLFSLIASGQRGPRIRSLG